MAYPKHIDDQDGLPSPQPLKVGLRPAHEMSMADLIARVELLSKSIDIQFTRIAQLQAEVDLLRKRG